MLTLNKPRRRNRLAVALAVFLLLGGLYMLAVALAPQLPANISTPSHTDLAKKLKSNSPSEGRVYIPKIGVDIAYQSGGAEVLESGAWWRAVDSGNPKDGGNFVIAAHRFQMGWTPAQTARQSPFYHIDKLETGDQIVVDYRQSRYIYEVSKIHRVSPSATEIEAPTDNNQLTLYSCTLGGSSDGREVIVARLVSDN